jgi:hypothetical protein
MSRRHPSLTPHVAVPRCSSPGLPGPPSRQGRDFGTPDDEGTALPVLKHRLLYATTRARVTGESAIETSRRPGPMAEGCGSLSRAT